MKAMILAAGFGKRLRPLTDHVAKPTLPVVNIPLILYALNLLKSAGIREVIVNLHHAPETVKKILGRGRKWKMKIRYSYEKDILGTGGGLKNVESFFSEEEAFVLINGDIICDINLRDAITFHQESDAAATMVLREDKNAEQFGVIGIDSEQRIRRFTDLVKPDPKHGTLKKCMFTGIHILSPIVFEYLPPTIEVCINQYAYPRMINNAETIFGFITNGYWSDLGTISSYWQTNSYLLANPQALNYFDHLGDYQFTPKREVDRVVRMGKNVHLASDAKIYDPVIIGDHCDIKKGSVIGPNVILGNDCVIEKNNRIENSILWPNTKTNENEEICKQIRGKKVKVELRANGKTAKLAS